MESHSRHTLRVWLISIIAYELSPQDISIKPFYDQSKLVEQTIDTVKTNLLEGGLLVILVLLLTVGNVRAALIVACAIPLSMTPL